MTRTAVDSSETGNRLSRRAVLAGAAGSAVALGGVPVVSGTSDEVTVHWTYEAGGGIGTSPTVVDGTVYVSANDLRVHAVDAATGDGQWSTDVDGTGTVSVVDDLVFAPGDGMVALDAATGDETWHHDQYSELGAPTVAGGVCFSSTGGDLVALEAATGNELWRFFDAAGAIVGSVPTVVDGTAYVGLGAASLFAIDAASGERQWWFETELNGHVNSSPTVVDGTVYVGSNDGHLYAIDAASGTEQWRHDLGYVESSPTVHDGTVYVGAAPGTGAGELVAIDAATGDEVWTFEAAVPNVLSSPTIADGVVYVGADGFDGHVSAVDAATGESIWTHTSDRWIRSSPTVVDGLVYVGSFDGTLYALEAAGSGSSEGSRVELGTLGHHDSWAETSPTIDLGTVGVPSEDDDTTAAAAGTDDADGSPGPGVAGAVTAIGAGYLLSRRLNR